MLMPNFDEDTVTMGEILDRAGRGQLRFRAFGEIRYWGQGMVFQTADCNPVQLLEDLINEGMIRVYSDENGLFVGPHNPACVGS